MTHTGVARSGKVEFGGRGAGRLSVIRHAKRGAMIGELANSYSLALGYLRRLVADVPNERLTEQTGGANNHPAWVIGHLVHSAQAIGGEMGLQPWLPQNWADQFGTGSIPCSIRERYPDKQALLGALTDAQGRVLNRLVELGENGLKVPLPDENYRRLFPTIGHAAMHILTVHVALHIGQVTVWRRAVSLGSLPESFA